MHSNITRGFPPVSRILQPLSFTKWCFFKLGKWHLWELVFKRLKTCQDSAAICMNEVAQKKTGKASVSFVQSFHFAICIRRKSGSWTWFIRRSLAGHPKKTPSYRVLTKNKAPWHQFSAQINQKSRQRLKFQLPFCCLHSQPAFSPVRRAVALNKCKSCACEFSGLHRGVLRGLQLQNFYTSCVKHLTTPPAFPCESSPQDEDFACVALLHLFGTKLAAVEVAEEKWSSNAWNFVAKNIKCIEM